MYLVEEAQTHLVIRVELSSNPLRRLGVQAQMLLLFTTGCFFWTDLYTKLDNFNQFRYIYLFNIVTGSVLILLSVFLFGVYSETRIFRFDKTANKIFIEDIGFWGSKGQKPSLNFSDVVDILMEEIPPEGEISGSLKQKTYRVKLLLKSNISVYVAEKSVKNLQQDQGEHSIQQIKEEVMDIVERVQNFIRPDRE